MAQWKVERVAIELPKSIEEKLNDLEQSGFTVIQIVPTEKHLIIISRKK